jgi:LacI family transcriptional regulator/LacI family repressor for deo operon, udp, cdd, tsx, nupC, and nupG
VLNGDHRVADATRKRVLAVIEELEYRPSSLARNLALGRTHMIAVVIPFLTNPSSVERLRGVVETLRSSRYDLMLFDVERPQTRDDLLVRLADRSTSDAVLVISLPLRDDEVARFGRARVPVVLVDGSHERLSHVAIDDVAGGRLATRHLLDLGHTRIAFVGDAPTVFGFTSSHDRRTGFEQALREAGVEPKREYILEAPHGREFARRLGTQLLSLRDPPTAVFAASDTQALGVLEAARAAGRRIPEELSVIGFDDVEAASYAHLSTVRQPLYESGALGTRMLIGALDGTDLAPVGDTLGLELVLRSTTAPP